MIYVVTKIRHSTFYIYLLVFFLFNILVVKSMGSTVSGVVFDKGTGECLINATIIDVNKKVGVYSNEYGFFSIDVREDSIVQLECRYVGYKTCKKTIRMDGDTSIIFKLEQGVNIDEVIVKADNSFLSYSHKPGVSEMKGDVITQIPSLLGEYDLARVLQLKPGVQSGKEGTGRLFVRGGSAGQNLVLLDGVPVYSPNHIAGFISVFNPNMVNYLKLYKSGFPPRLGGRSSSVLDVRMKDGNMKESSGSFSMGTITGNFYYELPISKDTSSLLIAGRRTIFDLFLMGYILLDTDGKSNAGYNLWDVNVKYNKKIDDKTRLYVSFYKGQDKFFRRNKDNGHDINETKYKHVYNNAWGNTVASLRLNKIYSNKLFSNYTLGFSNYSYHIKEKVEVLSGGDGTRMSLFRSKVSDFILSANYQYLFNNKHAFDFGFQANLHGYLPTHNQSYWEEDNITFNDSIWGGEVSFSPEIALYFSDHYQIGSGLAADVGIRAVAYFFDGNKNWSIEPRLSLNYKLNRNLFLGMSYDRMGQFTHLVSSTQQSLISDIWIPSTKNILPEKSNQYSLGGEYLFPGKQEYTLTIDVFYKQLYNLVENVSGLSFYGTGSKWNDLVLGGGEGKAYGAELLIEKKKGRINGSIAYTLSKNMRKFNGINRNEWFPYRYDRRHEVSIMLDYELNKHVKLAANWVFMSGEAASLPQYKYLIDIQQFDIESVSVGDKYDQAFYSKSRNSFRMPAYHRLDFSLNIERDVYRGRRTWSVGLYNAYNQMNSYYMYYDEDDKSGVKLYSVTLFPIMPSISYRLEF